jgi:formylglycine-generating enzyme required for sulfatase activity
MGSPLTEKGRSKDEDPQHEVRLSAFQIGKYEVTFDEYDEFCDATGRKRPSDMGWGRENRPVVKVNWRDAILYCNWRSTEEGLTPVYSLDIGTLSLRNPATMSVSCDFSANGYRLPTEAEWEYACRAGTQTATAFGDSMVSTQANFDGTSSYNASVENGASLKRTAPVGSYLPNAWGIYDMHGNVWEWCWDLYGPYKSAAQADPEGAESGGSRVLRGGCWNSGGQNMRSAVRYFGSIERSNNFVGFRVVRRP